jgi:hypothetical protein
MADFDRDRFLEIVKDMDYLDIIRYANSAAERLEGQHRRIKGVIAKRQSGIMSDVDYINSFLYFIQGHGRSQSLSDEEFNKFRPVVQALVDKEQFRPEVLNWFK